MCYALPLSQSPSLSLPIGPRAVLGLALMGVGTRNLETDPLLSLLQIHIEEGSPAGPNMKLAALLGLGWVFAGSQREDVANLLSPYVMDTRSAHSFELACAAALSLGFVYVGTAKEDAASLIADRLMTASPLEAGSAIARHLVLGLGLLFVGQGEAVDAILEILSVVEHPVAGFAKILVKACAFAGTGNVLAMQELLRVCAAHPEVR